MAACDVRTLFWPCIDSSRADRLGAASQTPCGRKESIRGVHRSEGGAPDQKHIARPIPLLFLQKQKQKKKKKIKCMFKVDGCYYLTCPGGMFLNSTDVSQASIWKKSPWEGFWTREA